MHNTGLAFNNNDTIDIPKHASKDLLHEKFIEAVLLLNESIVAPHIPYDMKLQNYSKTVFLLDLNALFTALKMQCFDHPRVELKKDVCMNCSFGKPLACFDVYSWNKTKPFYKFAYIIDVDTEGNSIDIYECNGYRIANTLNNSLC